jgi:hypothetical protein
MSYGSSSYGTATAPITEVTSLGVAPAAAATTASMTAPTIVLGVSVVAPAAAATATMTAPRVRLTPIATPYELDANSSQALTVRIEMSATADLDVIPVLPTSHWTEAQVRARRLSLIMPTPSLDSRGRPT